MSEGRIQELLRKAENGHRQFEIEQYREILECIIPLMLKELKMNAKVCSSRLPPERVKAKFYRSLASLLRHLMVQVKADLEHTMEEKTTEEEEDKLPRIRD